MKTSRSPITSGGSSRVQSTPASHTRGNGSLPRAIIQASGVHSSSSMASVTAPASTEVTSGSSASGAVSALAMSWPDTCASRVITGPSRTTQITPAAATDMTADAERIRRGPGLALPRPGGPGCPGGSPPRKAPPAAAAGLAAELTFYGRRDAGTGGRRRQQGEPTRLVLGQAGRGKGVLDEGDAGRGGLADGRDVDHLRRPVLRPGLDRDARLGVLRGVRRAAQVDLRGQLDVGQVQLDRLGDERAGRVQLARLQRRVERGLGEDLRRGRWKAFTAARSMPPRRSWCSPTAIRRRA